MSTLRFAVRVRAGARRTSVGGQWDGTGGPALIVAVSAPAVDGKANAAVLDTLAAAFGVRTRQFTIVTGVRSRDKIVELRDAPAEAREQLQCLLAASPQDCD